MKNLLWLDDERNPFLDENGLVPKDEKGSPFNINWVLNYEQFHSWIKAYGLPDAISFDGDLGGGKTGLDCAKLLVKLCKRNCVSLPDWYIHDRRYVGIRAMYMILSSGQSVENNILTNDIVMQIGNNTFDELAEAMNSKNAIIELIHPDAKMPVKFNDTDACWDVYATSMEEFAGKVIRYGLGFKIQLPPNTRLDIVPRSSIYKTGLMLSNCIGQGDEQYRGEYAAYFYNIIPALPNYKVGDRILQMRIENRTDVKFVKGVVDDASRGGGFGSTGLK